METAKYECKECGTLVEIDVETPLSQVRKCCKKPNRILIGAEGEKGKKRVENYEQRIHLVTRFSPVPYAEKLMKDTRFVYDNRKKLWRYNEEEGIYTDDAELYINSKLRMKLFDEEQQKRHYVGEIIDYIKGVCWTEKDMTTPPKNFIPFKNVMYDIDKDEFVDFSPEYFITNKIPHNIDSKYTECDMVDFFLEELVGDRKKLLYELMAYCLYRDYPYQKFFILYGDGNNGKSAFLKLMMRFIGHQNYASRKIQEFVTDKYASSDLFGKMMNVSADLPHTELSDSSTVRELTGEDPMTAQEKYKNSFKFFNYAKLIFSANEFPQVRDRTKAFDRRIYIIKFENHMKNPIPNIVDKLSTETEMSGLAWKLVKELKELKTRGFRFSYDPPVKEMAELYDELSNSLIKFLKEQTESDQNSKLPSFELKERFFNWCEEKGLRKWRVSEIHRTMEDKYVKGRMDFDFYDKDRGTLETSRIQAWEGLKWANS